TAHTLGSVFMSGGKISSQGAGTGTPATNYTLSSTVTVNADSTIDATAVKLAGTAGNLDFNVTAGTLTVSSVLSGTGMTKKGGGVMVLSAANTFGGVGIEGGTLRVTNTTGSGTGTGTVNVLNGGTLG